MSQLCVSSRGLTTHDSRLTTHANSWEVLMIRKRYSAIAFAVSLATAAVSLLAPASVSAQADNQLEVFSWWTSGGEAAALDQVFAGFAARRPAADIVNATIAGGGGSAARPVRQAR